MYTILLNQHTTYISYYIDATIVQEVKKLRVNTNDFKFIRSLAKGQFGEISLVRSHSDNRVYAMKTLCKADMLKQADVR